MPTTVRALRCSLACMPPCSPGSLPRRATPTSPRPMSNGLRWAGVWTPADAHPCTIENPSLLCRFPLPERCASCRAKDAEGGHQGNCRRGPVHAYMHMCMAAITLAKRAHHTWLNALFMNLPAVLHAVRWRACGAHLLRHDGRADRAQVRRARPPTHTGHLELCMHAWRHAFMKGGRPTMHWIKETSMPAAHEVALLHAQHTCGLRCYQSRCERPFGGRCPFHARWRAVGRASASSGQAHPARLRCNLPLPQRAAGLRSSTACCCPAAAPRSSPATSSTTSHASWWAWPSRPTTTAITSR